LYIFKKNILKYLTNKQLHVLENLCPGEFNLWHDMEKPHNQEFSTQKCRPNYLHSNKLILSQREFFDKMFSVNIKMAKRKLQNRQKSSLQKVPKIFEYYAKTGGSSKRLK